jgi:hypothetical protein
LYKFSGKIEVFPNEENALNGSLLANRTSVQRVRTSEGAHNLNCIELHGIRSRNGDITVQQYGFENDIGMKGEGAIVADGNVPTNHNRGPSAYRTSVNGSTRSNPLGESSFVTGQAAVNQTSSSVGAATWRGGPDAVQNVEHRVVASGDKTDVSRDMPSYKDQALNFTETEVDRRVSSDSNVDSASSRAAVRSSIRSNQETVTDYGAGEFDSVLQDTNISPLGTENLLMRGARLKNTEFIIGKFCSVSSQLSFLCHVCLLAFSKGAVYINFRGITCIGLYSLHYLLFQFNFCACKYICIHVHTHTFLHTQM